MPFRMLRIEMFGLTLGLLELNLCNIFFSVMCFNHVFPPHGLDLSPICFPHRENTQVHRRFFKVKPALSFL